MAVRIQAIWLGIAASVAEKGSVRPRKRVQFADQVKDTVQQVGQQVIDYVSTPRDLGCLSNATAAGAGAGATIGADLGLAGGPFAEVTVPGGAATGFGAGGITGFAMGMSACMTGGAGSGSSTSKGATGRGPQNLKEQLAAEQAASNPKAGTVVPLKNGMTDPRWPASDGWVKMTQNVNGVEVHYNYNNITQTVDDIKIK